MRIWCIIQIVTSLKHLLIGRHPRRTAIRIAVLGSVGLVFFGLVARPVRFDGVSMAPTYRDGGFRFMSPVLLAVRPVKRGDVVAIRMPGDGAFYVKRVLGLPGESVAFIEGRLIIDGTEMPEPYVDMRGNWALATFDVPTDHYFVAGDNRTTSFSGHTLGTVHRRSIAGIVMP